MERRDWLTLAACIALSQLAGIIGSISTASSVSTWYATLATPVIQPPNWLFGPVWLVLYTLIGIALYIVWKDHNRTALNWFAANWFFNLWWSIIFFGLRWPTVALVEIIVLVGLICGMLSSFRRTSFAAFALLLPYLGWVLFATVLNAAIVFLN